MYIENGECRETKLNVVPIAQSGAKPKLTLVKTSLHETYHKDLPPPTEIIHNAVYQGLTILAGPPKVGKSYLALGLASSVASGDPALGKLPVKRPGRVLYLSLEDGERRIRKRTRQMIKTDQYLIVGPETKLWIRIEEVLEGHSSGVSAGLFTGQNIC